MGIGEFIQVQSVRLFGASITWRDKRTDESWYREAVLAGSIPEPPEGECKGEGCWSQRRCEYCSQYECWSEEILSCVEGVTSWSLYHFYNGPGRGFADKPTVYKRGSRVKVSWYGGLDI
jgi:hypothetical protein